MLRVQPVYGSRFDADGSAQGPSCTLIEYGGVRVLWNVGWWGEATVVEGGGGGGGLGGAAGATPTPTPTSTSQYSDGCFPELPEHDVLIVSDSTLHSLGGLPLYYEHHWKPRCSVDSSHKIPMLSTFPTVKMGHMTLYDHHAAISLDGGCPPYSLEQMDNAFAQLRTIKYSQSISFQRKLSITAHRAGHVVGGALFLLQRLQDETQVVLTPPAYNIAKELHLDSATLLKYGANPDVLVTYPGGPAMTYIGKLYDDNNTHKKKHIMKSIKTRSGATKVLLETIMSVLRRDGNVLCPVDASGRVLELLLVLNQHWDKQRLGAAYNLVWLGPMVHNTLDYARSQLEWMNAQLSTQFEDIQRHSHPFALRHVHLCTSLQQLDALTSQHNTNLPTCVLATGLALEHGPARDLFLRWADNADHAILFTDSSRCFARRQRHVTTTTTQDATDNNMDTPQPSQSQESATDAASAPELPPPALVTRQSSLSRQVSEGTAVVVPDEEAEDEEEGNALRGTAVDPDLVSTFSAAAQLLQQWCLAKWEGREMDDSVMIDVRVPHRAPLAGQELKQFLAAEEAKRLWQKQQEEKRAMLREVELAKGRLRLGEEDGTTSTTTVSATTAGETTTSTSTTMATSSSSTGRPKKKSRFDSTLFLKFSKPLHLTFEVREEAVGVGQPDSIAKFGIGESIGRSGEILEDDYGIAVKPERFTDIVSGIVDPSKVMGGTGRIGEDRRGFGFAAGAGPKTAGAGTNAADDDAGDGDEMDEQAMEAADLSEGNGIIRGRGGRPPTKVTTVPRRLEVLAEIAYVPLEGRVDARAARQSVRALQPRQVVVMGGPAPENRTSDLPLEVVDEVTILAEAAQTFATDRGSRVRTPSDGEVVELNVGHAAYSARLIDTPFQTREEKVYNAENGIEPLEPVEPFETKVGSCTVSLLDAVATGQKVALDGSIVLAPLPVSIESAMKHPPTYISDGEVLLTDLRAELIAQGMKAEYSAQAGYSQLVVNGKVIVRKEQDSGRLDLEGPLCEDFYSVRAVICGQYVTL
ncbi:Probable cleavage and polyadenylation specificity factor subunit 2 [Seminavis robusta]|uniref:Cleavage and polyadenylation specificity factor subunit 2 n=1 Tax=Seminavis robusta TaxID=568900 RepID=A0A9N8DJW9_9STRA|nr:Probable cleavage and polyadenylation specificity factor subunit 2 [Seminavis robusta]|eukprot:Sro121_g058990.1 Probable cleavage and polyadenylation specificity factor subunit 2 (1034) ;mRNA; f:83984-87390